jgi:IclR family acetate operon transcriptional repressor
MTVSLASPSLTAHAVVTDGENDSSVKQSPLGAVPDTCRNRGVLDGAFAVLGALAQAEGGLGLTALARATGLAKTSTYRLAEQLVALGAVQCVDQRYYVGALVERIGQRWQPNPLLRRVAQGPVHTLATQSCAVASVRILHGERLRLICATAVRGQPYITDTADPESIARSATGRVLYATGPIEDAELPDCWTPREWRRLRDAIREPDATVADRQDAYPGICCLSAPVWWPNGDCAGAVSVQLLSPTLPPRTRDLVLCTARRITAALEQATP